MFQNETKWARTFPVPANIREDGPAQNIQCVRMVSVRMFPVQKKESVGIFSVQNKLPVRMLQYESIQSVRMVSVRMFPVQKKRR